MSDLKTEKNNAGNQSRQQLDGVVIGVIVGLNDNTPLVAFAGNQQDTGVIAHSTVALKAEHVGKQVALLFEGGNPERPIIIGCIQHPQHEIKQNTGQPVAVMDGERLVLSADKEIVLKCGKASVTMTRAGKIIVRGAYISTRSSGVNRIKGGSVQIN